MHFFRLVIEKEGSLPPVLFLQMDNAAKDNKTTVSTCLKPTLVYHNLYLQHAYRSSSHCSVSLSTWDGSKKCKSTSFPRAIPIQILTRNMPSYLRRSETLTSYSLSMLLKKLRNCFQSLDRWLPTSQSRLHLTSTSTSAADSLSSQATVRSCMMALTVACTLSKLNPAVMVKSVCSTRSMTKQLHTSASGIQCRMERGVPFKSLNLTGQDQVCRCRRNTGCAQHRFYVVATTRKCTCICIFLKYTTSTTSMLTTTFVHQCV